LLLKVKSRTCCDIVLLVEFLIARIYKYAFKQLERLNIFTYVYNMNLCFCLQILLAGVVACLELANGPRNWQEEQQQPSQRLLYENIKYFVATNLFISCARKSNTHTQKINKNNKRFTPLLREQATTYWAHTHTHTHIHIHDVPRKQHKVCGRWVGGSMG